MSLRSCDAGTPIWGKNTGGAADITTSFDIVVVLWTPHSIIVVLIARYAE